MNDFVASIMLMSAVASTDGYLPYWMTTNQYGLMPERRGGLALMQVYTQSDARSGVDGLKPKSFSSGVVSAYVTGTSPGCIGTSFL